MGGVKGVVVDELGECFLWGGVVGGVVRGRLPGSLAMASG